MKTPREILEKLVAETVNEDNPRIDKALIDLNEYHEEHKQSEQYILGRVEIDKAWIKKLILESKLLDELGAERIAEGIKAYSPIRLIEQKGEVKI